MIPFKLEYTIEEVLAAQPSSEQMTLKNLTGLNLPKREAAFLYEQILDHKWNLGEKLKRDVGLKVAAIDFVENFYQPVNFKKPRSNNFAQQIKRFVQPLSTTH